MSECEVDEEINPFICVLGLLISDENEGPPLCGSDMESPVCRIAQGLECAAYQRSFIELNPLSIGGLNPQQAVYFRHALFDDTSIVGSCDFFSTALQHALEITSEMGKIFVKYLLRVIVVVLRQMIIRLHLSLLQWKRKSDCFIQMS